MSKQSPSTWREEKIADTFIFRGIEFPFTCYRAQSSAWPNTEGEGGSTGNVGQNWWTCNGCGREVARAYNDGDGWTCRESWEEAAKAFVYHRDNCPALKP